MKSLNIVVLLVIFVSVVDIGVCKDESLNADGTSKQPLDLATFRTGLIGLFQQKTGHAIPKKATLKVLPKRRLEATAVETPNANKTSKQPIDMATFRTGLISLFGAKTGSTIPGKPTLKVVPKRRMEATVVETPNANGTSKHPMDMATFRTGLISLFQANTGRAIPKKGAIPVLAKRQLGSIAEKKNYRNNNAKIEKALDQAA
jgi:ribosomal protein S10